MEFHISLLEELATETAYKLIEKSQDDGAHLPENVQSNVRSVLVYDNIGRLKKLYLVLEQLIHVMA